MFKLFKENKWTALSVFLLVAGSTFFLASKPSLQKRLLSSAKGHQIAKEFDAAVEDYERVVRYAPDSTTGLEAARLGGEICLYEIKDYAKAIFFFRHLVLHSQRISEIRWAQKKLAEIFYDKLNNYNQAIVEYQRLLQANPQKDELAEYRVNLGKAYFYIGNFDQAISEADDFISKNPNDPKTFDMLMLKANAFLAQKKIEDALTTYALIEKQFPQSEALNEVKLSKSLAYEDKKDWDRAIQVLEEIKDVYPHPDVIALKIKSIQRRKARKRE